MAQNKKNEFGERSVRLSELFKALAHPARIEIVRTIAEKEMCICGEIVDVLPLAQSTVSQHLKELKTAGIITGEVDGPKSCYCLNEVVLKEMQDLLAGLFRHIEVSKKCC